MRLLLLDLLEFVKSHPNYLHVEYTWTESIHVWLANNINKVNFSYLYDVNNDALCIVKQKVISLDGNYYKLLECEDITNGFSVDIIKSLYTRYGRFYFTETKVCPHSNKYTPRSWQVIALLLLGYNINEVCNILSYSRSYWSKYIGEEICPQFGVAGYSSKQLLDKLVNLRFYSFINPLNIKLFLSNQTNEVNIQLPEHMSKYKDLVSLLQSNLSLSDIALRLNCSRNNIKKIITRYLLPEFNLSNYKDLKLFLRSNQHVKKNIITDID